MQIKAKLYVFFQYFVPQHALSRLAGKIANSHRYWLKSSIIRNFIKHYKVDLSIAELKKEDDYPSFNSFFTRKLDARHRPITEDPNIASPVDGCVSQAGNIHQHTLFQAKGRHFNLNDLLGDKPELANLFSDGKFATLYLAPKDYHRVHMPVRGRLTETMYIPGKLFSVNQTTTQGVSRLFSRNERLICMFETDTGPMAVIFVGAMIVGHITTVWADYPARTFEHKTFKNGLTLEKGAELGHFSLGSTVILLFPNHTMHWNAELTEDATVTMGSSIGRMQV